ncbi:hypothetical protein FRB95_002803 [Tulasnella sp. JGI-2019a]|nr:hypothetical protein FRB95_002803 [Tulasnella sp. JGI-2019a]
MAHDESIIEVSSSSPTPEPSATRWMRCRSIQCITKIPPQQSNTNAKPRGKGKEKQHLHGPSEDPIVLLSDEEFPSWSRPGPRHDVQPVAGPSRRSPTPFPIDPPYIMWTSDDDDVQELNGKVAGKGVEGQGDGGDEEYECYSVPKRAAGGSQNPRAPIPVRKPTPRPSSTDMYPSDAQDVWNEDHAPGPSKTVDQPLNHAADDWPAGRVDHDAPNGHHNTFGAVYASIEELPGNEPALHLPPPPILDGLLPQEPAIMDQQEWLMQGRPGPGPAIEEPINLEAGEPGDGSHHPIVLEEEAPPAEPVDLVAQYLAEVIQLIPNVQVEYAETLVNTNMINNPNLVVEACVNHLFDDPTYPKIEMNKGKRKQSDRKDDDQQANGSGSGADNDKRTKIDWGSIDRQVVDKDYSVLAMEDLSLSFKYITKACIREALMLHRWLYYPTYFHLRQASSDPGFYGHKKTASAPKRKGKGPQLYSEEFELERQAVIAVLTQEQDPNHLPSPAEQSVAVEVEPAEVPLPEGEGVECGCCFGEYGFDQMIQCPEAHLFCKDCAKRNAAEALGQRKCVITCMDQSVCKLEFTQSELERCLDSKALELLDRIRAEKAVADCGFESLDECPFCDFKCIIENDQEKLFRCENEECQAVTCRQCKRVDHVPKSCQEMEGDRKLDARHAVEEAMTAALMRKCPKCSKAFVKEHGCNKMTCPHCSQLSCYICKQAISGYDHFNEQPGGRGGPGSKGKCPLWEPNLDQRHHDEVAAAAKIALQKQREEQPDIEEEALKVDLPPVPPPPGPPAGQNAPLAPPQFAFHPFPDQGMFNLPNLFGNIANPNPNPNPPVYQQGLQIPHMIPPMDEQLQRQIQLQQQHHQLLQQQQQAQAAHMAQVRLLAQQQRALQMQQARAAARARREEMEEGARVAHARGAAPVIAARRRRAR